MSIINRISIADGPHEGHKTTDVPRSGYTASGYGRKLPTQHMLKLNGKWRRVYVCQVSNAGTAYIPQGEDWIVIDD